MWVYVVVMQSQANDDTPDKIQSKGKCLPVERSLSEEQCEYENTIVLPRISPLPHMYGDVIKNQKTQTKKDAD